MSVTTHLEEATVNFVLNFAKLCYHLVKSGNIKISAVMQANHTLNFPDLGDVTIDQERAETFGLMTVSNDGPRLVLNIYENLWSAGELSAGRVRTGCGRGAGVGG